MTEGIDISTDIPSILVIEVLEDLKQPDNLVVVAQDENGNKTSETIVIVETTFKKVELSQKYFKFDTTVKENDTILGFSDEVIDDVIDNINPLEGYNSLDFSNQQEIRYIHGDCQFDSRVFVK
jgi:hypothetical protein